MPGRGFQSTVDNRLNFGLGKVGLIDSLVAIWPSGKVSVLKNVKPNQTINLNQKDAFYRNKVKPQQIQPLFNESSDQYGIDFEHRENDFSDFDREQLSFQMLSTEGPHMAKADVNGDKLDDFFICGASGQPGALYVQQAKGRFQKTNTELFEKDKVSESTDCIFFDADNDQDLDLMVCSGGSDATPTSTSLNNRLYLNNKGAFTRSTQTLYFPGSSESSSCVTADDFDNDGDQDLFIGVRLKTSYYGLPASSYILTNDGTGKFTNATNEIAPELVDIGMITDAEWFDFDKDGDSDLAICGEYMPVKIFENQKGKLTDVTKKAKLEYSNGWWNRLIISDLNNDGFPDIIAGNHGLNSRFKANQRKPISMYVSDFDQNGSIEQIICSYNGSKSYPMILRHDLVAQIPSLKKNFLKYDDYKGKTVEDIFSRSQMKTASKAIAYDLRSSVFINNKNKTFTSKPLPAEAQFSVTYGLNADDYDHDGKVDIIIGGNLFESKPETGIYDASYGLFLKGDGEGGFKKINTQNSGIFLKGQIRDILNIKAATNNLLLFAVNNQKVKVYVANESKKHK
jgi:hypothetical protein